MLKLKSIWHGAVFGVAALLIFSAVALQLAQNQPIGAVGATCSPNDVVFLSPHNGDGVSDTVNVDVAVSSYIGTNEVGKVNILHAPISDPANKTFAADAMRETAVSSNWEAEWNSGNLYPGNFPNGPAYLFAKIYNTTNTPICTSVPVQVDVFNDNAPDSPLAFRLVRKDPLGDNFIGPTNFLTDFEVEGQRDDGQGFKERNSETLFNWYLGGGSTVGYISGENDDKKVDFWTGSNSGTNVLIVDAENSGFTDSLHFNITVDSNGNITLPGLDDDSTGDTVENEETDTDEENDGTENDPVSLSDNPDLRRCIVDILGEDDYQEILEGDRVFTFAELEAVDQCFAGSRYHIPSNVAPIAPSKILDVPENNRSVKVNRPTQITSSVTRADSIRFSGVAFPNSMIVIYIFSEPLVLTTTTDDSGNWSYVLEDPLAPGEHEIYVAVEDGEGVVVRSSAVTFDVRQQASVGTNPGGLSLTLDLSDPQSNLTIYYVSGVAAVMLVGLGMYVFLVRRKNNLTEPSTAEEDSKKATS